MLQEWVSAAVNCKEGETSSSSPKQIMHSTNTLEHALIILKCMVNMYVIYLDEKI